MFTELRDGQHTAKIISLIMLMFLLFLISGLIDELFGNGDYSDTFSASPFSTLSMCLSLLALAIASLVARRKLTPSIWYSVKKLRKPNDSIKFVLDIYNHNDNTELVHGVYVLESRTRWSKDKICKLAIENPSIPITLNPQSISRHNITSELANNLLNNPKRTHVVISTIAGPLKVRLADTPWRPSGTYTVQKLL